MKNYYFKDLKNHIDKLGLSQDDNICDYIPEEGFANSNIDKVNLYGAIRKIRDKAFANSNIKEFEVDNINNCFYDIIIEDNVFENCKNLNKVTLSNSIKYVGQNAFKGCSSLKTINVSAYIDQIDLKTYQSVKRDTPDIKILTYRDVEFKFDKEYIDLFAEITNFERNEPEEDKNSVCVSIYDKSHKNEVCSLVYIFDIDDIDIRDNALYNVDINNIVLSKEYLNDIDYKNLPENIRNYIETYIDNNIYNLIYKYCFENQDSIFEDELEYYSEPDDYMV